MGIRLSVIRVGAGPVLSTPAVSFDTPVLSFVEGLRTNGWGVEACAESCRSGIALPQRGAASGASTVLIADG